MWWRAGGGDYTWCLETVWRWRLNLGPSACQVGAPPHSELSLAFVELFFFFWGGAGLDMRIAMCKKPDRKAAFSFQPHAILEKVKLWDGKKQYSCQSEETGVLRGIRHCVLSVQCTCKSKTASKIVKVKKSGSEQKRLGGEQGSKRT